MFASASAEQCGPGRLLFGRDVLAVVRTARFAVRARGCERGASKRRAVPVSLAGEGFVVTVCVLPTSARGCEATAVAPAWFQQMSVLRRIERIIARQASWSLCDRPTSIG